MMRKKMAKPISSLIIWRNQRIEKMSLSPPHVDSEGNVFLICTCQQTVYVLKAVLNVRWGASANFLRWKRLCLYAFFGDIKRSNKGQFRQFELCLKMKQRTVTEIIAWSLFNHIFQFPVLKLQIDTEVRLKSIFPAFMCCCLKPLFPLLTLSVNLSNCFSCSVWDPSPEVQELRQLGSD